MNVGFYRFFFMKQGRTVSAEILECDGDSAAVEKAKELLSKSSFNRMEVWQGARKVGVVERNAS